MFEGTVTVRFRDIDYAGRAFYAKAFDYVHDVEEDWFETMGYSIPEMKFELGILFPVGDVEAEYFEGMYCTDDVRIRITVPAIYEKAFEVRATAQFPDSGSDVFEVRLTRICMDVESERACEIPEVFVDCLEPHLAA